YIPTFERDKGQNRRYLREYFELRKRVFCDQHGWVKANEDGTETDYIDESYNVYILYLDEESNTVLGGVRLAPSTGNTLLHSVWSDMLPEPDDFRSPNIWEATRFCVDEAGDGGRSGNFVNKVCLALILAVLDFSAQNGISFIIAVCELRLIDMFSAFKGEPEIVSTKIESDGCEIACVIWSTEEKFRRSIKWARPFLGGSEPMSIQAA
ncbi:MAG: acyl-homoserine-lactone synthase, partial [Pseudomonadota bacterium]